MGKSGRLNNALRSDSSPKLVPERSAPITVPIPRAPHGTAHCPQVESTAARSGEKPAARRMGALITIATPNPVTDSKNGAAPTTTTRARASPSDSNRPKSTYNTSPEVPSPAQNAPPNSDTSKEGYRNAPASAAASAATPDHVAGHRSQTSVTPATTNGAPATTYPNISTMLE